jgi:chemotaxis family two-component system sensor kinase Cph1
MDIGLEVENIPSVNITSLKEAPIHISSKIQPHGILLVLAEPDLKILQVTDNTLNFFGRSAEDMVQKRLVDLLDAYQLERIKSGLSEQNLDFINPTKILVRNKGDDYTVFDALFHRNSEGFLISELEPAIYQENIPFRSFYHLARASINGLESTKNLRESCQIIVQEVQKVTNFDRVMLYKFDDDGHGSIIGEEKIADLEPYLGLHYPESDIPKPPRKLFIENCIRLIPDANFESV